MCRSKPTYRFSHRGGDRYYWYRTHRLAGDSRTEQISCNVDWFWQRAADTSLDDVADVLGTVVPSS